ncbi:MAG: NAD(P)-dependent oxidoreductase, partial [Acidobacteriota bacterium]
MRTIFKVTDFIERDLKWEEAECRKLGLGFEYYQLKNAPASRIIRLVKDADIVLVNMAKFDAQVLAGLENTKLIIRHGIGYDNVDVEAATRQGIVFANERTASSEDVAEHAVMLILETYKKKKIQDKILRDWVKTRRWSSRKIHPLYRLHGKTLGIVGCGNIGSRVLKKMRGFGVE